MKKGAILVDHTTASAEVARELDAAAKAKGLGFLDAPVSGGQAGALNGRLTIMVGGDAEPFKVAEPVMRHYGRAVTLMGPAGSGQLTKMVNQICIAGVRAGALRGPQFRGARRPRRQEGDRRHLQGRGAVLADREPRARPCSTASSSSASPSTGCARISRSASPRRGATARRCRCAALVDQFYARVQERGGGRWDTSSLIHLLAKP